MQQVPSILARISLQIRHNDLHLAHEFIHYFQTTRMYAELLRDIVKVPSEPEAQHKVHEKPLVKLSESRPDLPTFSEAQLIKNQIQLISESKEIIDKYSASPNDSIINNHAFRTQLEAKLAALKLDYSSDLTVSSDLVVMESEKSDDLQDEQSIIAPPPLKILPLDEIHLPLITKDPDIEQTVSEPSTPLDGVPPPPPPPMLSSIASPTSPSRSCVVKTSLHWNAIHQLPIQSENSTGKDGGINLWNVISKKKLGQRVKLDTKEFESLFCIDPSNDRPRLNSSLSTSLYLKDGKRSSRSASLTSAWDDLGPAELSMGFSSNKNLASLPPLLDLRRTNNIAIGLSRFSKRLSDEALFNVIVNKQPGILSLDDLGSLKPLLPSTEERELYRLSADRIPRPPPDSDNISLYSVTGTGGSSTLRVDQFMLQMSAEPNISWMVDALIFEQQFEQDCDEIKKQLQAFIDALSALYTDPDIPILLGVVLEVGNLAYFEYGRSKFRRKAVGFHIDSLDKLRQVKSRGSTTAASNTSDVTLLDYLAKVITDQLPKLLLLPDRLEPIFQQPRQIESALLLNNLKELQINMSKLKSPPYKDSNWIDSFMKSLLAWRESKKQSMKDLNSLHHQFTTTWDTVSRYFGEQPIDRSPEDMVNIWDSFLKQLRESINNFSDRKGLQEKSRSGSRLSLA
jgi:hypothetical protein